MSELEYAALIGALATIGTYIVGVVASRQFGLPGLARSVETEQAALILVQKERLDLMEGRVKELESCQGELKDTQKRVRSLERTVADNHAELVRLYRLTDSGPTSK